MMTLRCLAVVLLILLLSISPVLAATEITCWFPPTWQDRTEQAEKIAAALSDDPEISVIPRIARNYPEIIKAFTGKGMNLAYAGSFVQAIISIRQLGVPMLQNMNGREYYQGLLIYPAYKDPYFILANQGRDIAYARGSSSGESAAKAATDGEASIGVASHQAACKAVLDKKAAAAVVKNWWWEDNQGKFSSLKALKIPGISKSLNPDHILSASQAVPDGIREKLQAAAFKQAQAFGGQSLSHFKKSQLLFSLWLMSKGGINPLTYQW